MTKQEKIQRFKERLADFKAHKSFCGACTRLESLYEDHLDPRERICDFHDMFLHTLMQDEG